MRLAVFSPYLPAPENSGGRIRITRLLSRVADRHELHLFAKANAREAAEAQGCAALAIFESRSVQSGRLEPRALLREPERVVSGCPGPLLRAYRDAHARHPFDGALVEHAHAGRFARALGVPFVLDEHNIESRYLAAKLQARRAGRVHARFQVARLARFETQLWPAAARVVAVSENDAAEIRARTGVEATVIENGVRLSDLSGAPPSERDPATILFVGLMDHAPNVAAAAELARDVLPRVRQRVPAARLVLCGKNPATTVRRLASAHVEVTGGVPSVAPYWKRATVFANALRSGAGTSLKVAEALAAGVPMVSTAAGVRGFAALRADEHYLAAESAASLADRILDVLQAPGAYRRMTEAGAAVARTLDWDRLSERYLQVVEEGLEAGFR